MAFKYKRYSVIILLFFHNIIYLSCSTIIAGENIDNRMVKNPASSPNSQFDENSDSLRKNDDAHIRLYYKSNSPGRTVSHELEHRFVKNPNYQFNQQYRQEANSYQPKLNSEMDLNYYDPRVNFIPNFQYNEMPSNQNYFQDLNKNKETMLNLHYHGNSLDGFDSTFSSPQQDSMNFISNQQRNLKANFLKMMLMNQPQTQQPEPSILMAQRRINKPVYNQYYTDQSKSDRLKYKIVHLKFKVEPQYGRVMGQGIIETDNGNFGPNSRKVSLLPREIPELIKRLLVSAQSQQQSSFQNPIPIIGNLKSTGLIKKREDESGSSSGYDENFSVEKREDNNLEHIDQNESHKTTKNDYFDNDEKDVNKRVKKNVSDEASSFNDEEKMNDSEFSESFKSLQRRDDLDNDISSLSENELDSEKQILLRNDEIVGIDDSSSEYN